ncbi:hypothetical protein [Sphingomonas abietis]|uniref:Uncharacterized protein n=1 Tax=Sphingomonas abietis TaxID=3012344 RepID=A0ABY7NXS3_9SPHN|nr:hypothetical protein [Sphingomonas abietis]WBO24171.1 hypothetical protein PBT88_08725 [Sphingomonas abietis]
MTNFLPYLDDLAGPRPSRIENTHPGVYTCHDTTSAPLASAVGFQFSNYERQAEQYKKAYCTIDNPLHEASVPFSGMSASRHAIDAGLRRELGQGAAIPFSPSSGT